ncbi:hypothetical protein BCR44DRAFT_1422895 [Catenaria anguillulae PL171]|uniref:Uncharacterized protein n=1 Tax=Catenaria anguillulae PL171 TaxID=765915 RepID=A0A1Y2I3M3_9FUNG|nr:hypothetical protein BCR44DRAFT_1422895 [Catenaria anguillulae PL171]
MPTTARSLDRLPARARRQLPPKCRAASMQVAVAAPGLWHSTQTVTRTQHRLMDTPPSRSAPSPTFFDIGSWLLVPAHGRRQPIARRPPLVTPSGGQLIFDPALTHGCCRSPPALYPPPPTGRPAVTHCHRLRVRSILVMQDQHVRCGR